MILAGSDPQAIAHAVARLQAGDLLGLPTETVYGLAANAEDDAAVARIFSAKGRPADHPLIVHVGSADSVPHFASEVPAFAHALMQAFWPGPLTLILPRRAGVAAAAAGGQSSVGLRCPAHPVALAVLHAGLAGSPPVHGLAAPSANQFGRVSPTTAAHVQGEFGPELLILDGGPCAVGIESTIIDCTRGVPVLLRPGAITPQQVQAACGQAVCHKDELAVDAPAAPRASGTLESHYAPQATVRLLDAAALQAALHAWSATGAPALATRATLATLAVYARHTFEAPATVHQQPMPADAAATAQQLFAVLRALDAQGVQEIWIESLPASSDWDGVRDRLQRAAASE